MGWVILGIAVVGFIWLWVKASRSPRIGDQRAYEIETDQLGKRGPRRSGGGPM
jgi:hypothetical protein